VRRPSAQALGAYLLVKTMNRIELAVKAIELLKDWSIWMVGIETGAIAITGSLIANGKGYKTSRWALYAFTSFMTSIFFASWLLLGLPSVTIRLAAANPDHTVSVYGMRIFDLIPVPVWVFALFQTLWFVIGVVMFWMFLIHRAGGTDAVTDERA
jgi:hypothetical protein